MAQDDLDDVLQQLATLVRDYELGYARHAEFIPDGTPPPSPEFKSALDAAVCGGAAMGLRHAIEIINNYVSQRGEDAADLQ